MEAERERIGKPAPSDRAVGDVPGIEHCDTAQLLRVVQERADEPAVVLAPMVCPRQRRRALRRSPPVHSRTLPMSPARRHASPPGEGPKRLGPVDDTPSVVDEAVSPADERGRDAGELCFLIRRLDLRSPVGVECEAGVELECAAVEFAPHEAAHRPGPQRRAGRDAVVEANDACGVLPSVAVVEPESGRELVPAPGVEVVLVDDEHPRAERGTPLQIIEQRAVARVRLVYER